MDQVNVDKKVSAAWVGSSAQIMFLVVKICVAIVVELLCHRTLDSGLVD